MRQLHVTHPAGSFNRCSQCQREPKHIASYGTNDKEPLMAGRQSTERHHLECCPCARRTGKHPTVDAAIGEWNNAFATTSRPLRSIAQARRAASA